VTGDEAKGRNERWKPGIEDDGNDAVLSLVWNQLSRVNLGAEIAQLAPLLHRSHQPFDIKIEHQRASTTLHLYPPQTNGSSPITRATMSVGGIITTATARVTLPPPTLKSPS
jgi:hypothetical protein